MAVSFKKILKRILITLVFIVLILSLTVGVFINFIFTPSKLTPKIVELAEKYIDGVLEIGSVELTFFSTFPELSIEIRDGLLISNTGDSLASFSSFDVYLNPISFIQDEELYVDMLYLEDPIIFTQIDSLGVINWDIFEKTVAPDSEVGGSENMGVDVYFIDNIEINNGAFKFQDYTNYFSVSIERMDVFGNVHYLNELISCDLDLAINNMSLTLNEDPIINPVSINFHSKSNISLKENLFSLDTVSLKVIDHELELTSSGIVELDSLGGVNVDLKNRFFTSNIREALDLIPIRYVNLEELEGKGKVDLKVDLLGKYDSNQFPVVVIDLEITDGEASYRGFPKRIELFETKIKSRIDYINKNQSSVELNKLKVVSDGISVDMNGEFTRILTNPRIVVDGNGKIDFKDLLATLPVKHLRAAGKVDFDLETNFFLEDIVNYNYGKIELNGNLRLSDLDLNYKSDSIIIKSPTTSLSMGQQLSSSKFGMTDSRLLNGELISRNLRIEIRDIVETNASWIRVIANTIPLEDTTKISPLKIFYSLDKGDGVLGDTLSLTGKNIKGYVQLQSANNNPRIPVFRSEFFGGRIRVENEQDFFQLNKLDYKFRFIKREDKWPIYGDFKFEKLVLFTKVFPQRILIEKTSIGVKPGELLLNNANLNIGRSTSITMSGKILELQKTIFQHKSLKAKLELSSSAINLNQLSRVAAKGESYESVNVETPEDTTQTSSDESTVRTLVIPENLDFELKINLKKVRYGKLVLREVNGDVNIKNQVLKISNLLTKTKAADMVVDAKYVAKNENKARANFNINLTQVNVKHMMEVMPFMDTLLPMAKDFEGIVNIGLIGSAKIGEHMSVDESSLKAVARLEGQNLVLLDGETFQYLAKTLKFKNREKNVLDTLAVEMAIENGTLEIFPSLVTMDRYQVAVGGIQNLDLTYDYHISVLKSPLPFKTGIDITGKAEEYDYKITKAKYKYIFSDKEKDKEKVDAEMLKRKNDILNSIQFDD